jgi:hypothetical protein
MTRTKKKKSELDAAWSAGRKELHEIVKQEFPVGTKVWWYYGTRPQYGVVLEVPEYDWNTDVKVRNVKTMTVRSIDAVDLEHWIQEEDK